MHFGGISRCRGVCFGDLKVLQYEVSRFRPVFQVVPLPYQSGQPRRSLLQAYVCMCSYPVTSCVPGMVLRAGHEVTDRCELLSDSAGGASLSRQAEEETRRCCPVSLIFYVWPPLHKRTYECGHCGQFVVTVYCDPTRLTPDMWPRGRNGTEQLAPPRSQA